MSNDDRLASVLKPTVDSADARIQYRQLIELLGTSAEDPGGELIEVAYRRLAELSKSLAIADRVAVLADPALRLRSFRLIATLAQSEPPVALAAFHAADAGGREWRYPTPAHPEDARFSLSDRCDPATSAADALATPGIGELASPAAGAAQVDSDAVYPSAPATPPPGKPAPLHSPLERTSRSDAGQPGSAIHAFDFTTDKAGCIIWCESRVAPMVCGVDLSEFPELSHALRHHQPMRAASVTLPGAPAIAGAWQIDANPDFSLQGGHYLGHIGRFRRRAAVAAPAVAGSEADREADHLRQLLHELRNPINAIQGFAEIIQQQLFGPTPHEYRALAAVIAADAARILAGFGELERLARLAGRTMDLIAGETDLAACLAATVERLKPYTDPRANGFRTAAPTGGMAVQLAPIEIERLCWRLLATLAGCASPGENLSLELRRQGAYALLIMQLPASLATQDDTSLLQGLSDTSGQTLSVGMFGTGFALRLAAREANAAGGRLEHVAEYLKLFLPMLPPEARIPAKDTHAIAGHAGSADRQHGHSNGG